MTPLAKGRPPQKITWWMRAYMEAVIRIYPTAYLREVRELLAKEFQLQHHEVPSLSSIVRLFRELRITRKKCIYVARERMSPHNQRCRQLFIQWRRAVDPRRVYFFDETHFDMETDEREFGRTDSGLACPSFRLKGGTHVKLSTLGTCGFNEGVILAVPVVGAFNALLINEVIEKQILPLLPRHSYLVADNASIHNEAALCRILARKNITLVKLPAYAYDLNPMEMIFAQGKAIARYNPGFLRDNAMLAIITAFQQVRTANVRRYYRKSWRIMT